MAINFLRKPYFRFGLRFFFLVVTLFCAWIAIVKTGAERQASFVKRVVELDGAYHYDFEFDANGKVVENRKSKVPSFLIRFFGVDMFHDVVEVRLFSARSDGYARLMGGGSERMFDNEPRMWGPKRLAATAKLIDDLSTLESLRTISLPAIKDLDEVFAQQLASLKCLESVTVLSGSDLSDQGLAQLKNLENFKRLSIESSKITDDSLTVIGRMENLEFLYLGKHPFTDEGVKKLAGLKNLRYLVLDAPNRNQSVFSFFLRRKAKNSSSRVTDEGIRSLEHVSNLRYLSVYGTSVSEEYVEAFKAKNPGCQVTAN